MTTPTRYVDRYIDLPSVAEARLIARALLFTAGEDFGGVDTESFENIEREWMVALGRALLKKADELEATDG